jgi:hypothetical protein
MKKLLRKMLVLTLILFGVIILLLAGPLYNLASGRASLTGDHTIASREPANIAPNPDRTREAIVQVYAARAFRWKGAFAVHSWIAMKPKDAPHFTTHEVVRWFIYDGGGAIQSHEGHPDRFWYGAKPEVLGEVRGASAEAAIAKIERAIEDYPYKGFYRSWPGPNSNTFTAFVLRRVPELSVDLPPTAIGKDYLGPTTWFAPAPSLSGYQFSAYGVAGALLSREEGLEFNLLGLSFGVDPGEFAIRLPGVGVIKP